MLRILALAALTATAGCATTQVSYFSAAPGQEVVTRDGVPALVSKQGNTVVLVSQAKRDQNAGDRPAYVVGILNAGQEPAHFNFESIQVDQVANGQVVRHLETYNYNELVAEEKTRQVAAAILVGLAAGANSIAAANAGYYSGSGTVYSPYGTSTVVYSGYDPLAASIASSQASMQNNMMIAQAAESGQARLDGLEGSILKDSTIFPGEWYGGQLQFARPKSGQPKNFLITVPVGPDVHRINVALANAG